MLQEEHSAILSAFIKLPFVIKIFVLSIFEWPFYTRFTVTGNPLLLVVLNQNCLTDIGLHIILSGKRDSNAH